MSLSSNGKRLIVLGDQQTGGYMLIVNEDTTEAPLSLFTWDNAGKITEVTLDHKALEDIAEAFTAYTEERGTENGKEERLYS